MTAIPKPENTVVSLIDQWWERQEEPPRPHLGASLLGHPCERWLWLTFRWAIREKFSGRMLRLFNRGQREEAVIVENLRRIGVEIHSTCLDEDGQSRVDLAPHVGGSVDGIIESGVPEAPKSRHIAEFKTHNLKSFTELKQKGVFEAKRRHWCQMQCYMSGTGIKRALYIAVCKDNDEIYTERVEYNPQAARDIIERGARIVLTERIPPPLSENPSWYQCKMCPAWDFCFNIRQIQSDCVNCRTCAHVTPMPDGTWKCENIPLYNMDPIEQLEGCDRHVLHPDLVPWPLLGSDDDGNGIYEIDGKKVVNGKGGVLSANLLNGEREPKPEEAIPF